MPHWSCVPHSGRFPALANVTLSIDDSLLQAAPDARCDFLLSEDLQHGRRFGSLEVANPFLPSAAHEKSAARSGKSRPHRR